MSYDSIFINGERQRKRSIAAVCCYCSVKMIKKNNPERTLTSIVDEYMTLFDINEDVIPKKWLCDEYYRIQKRDLGTYQFNPNENSDFA